MKTRTKLLSLLLAAMLLLGLLPASAFAANGSVIEDVYITGFLPPVAGMSAVESLQRLGVRDGADYAVSAYWTNYTDGAGRPVHFQNAFPAGASYRLVLTVTPTGSRSLRSTTRVHVYGLNDAYVQAAPTLASNGALTLRTELIPVQTAPQVTHVGISGFSTPIIGELPYGREALSVYEGAVEIRDAYWTAENSSVRLAAPFQENVKYWFHVELKTLAPAVFANTYTWESGYGRIQDTDRPDNEEKTEASFIIASKPMAQIRLDDASAFPDATFRSFVKANYDANNNNILEDNERAYVTDMSITGEGNTLTSLEGLWYFTALESLDCSDNALTELDVSPNKRLVTLNCARNNISHLTMPPLKDCRIEELDLSGNAFEYFNYSSGIPTLKVLRLNDNSDMWYLNLSKFPALETVYASNCAINTVVLESDSLKTLSLTGNSSLATLNISRAPILLNAYLYGEADTDGPSVKRWTNRDVDPYIELSVGKNVQIISGANDGDVAINETNFPDFEFREFVKLKYDQNSDNHLSAAEIAAATALTDERSNFGSLKGIEFLSALKTIRITESAVETINLSALKDLESLSMTNGSLTEVDLSGLQKLRTATLYGNELTAASVEDAPSLEYLDLSGNKLTAVYAANCPALATLDLSNNPGLGVCDLEGDAALGEADLHGTQITFLDLQEHPLLLSLVEDGDLTEFSDSDDYNPNDYTLDGSEFLSVNPGTSFLGVTALPFSAFPDSVFRGELEAFDTNENGVLSRRELDAVTELQLDGVGIQDLTGVEQFRNLEYLDVSGNYLTELDVSDLPALKDLRIGDNPLETFVFKEFNNPVRTFFFDAANNLSPDVFYSMGNLTDLMIGEDSVNAEELDDILTALSEADASLRYLDIDYNDMGELNLHHWSATSSLYTLRAVGCNLTYLSFDPCMCSLYVYGNHLPQLYLGELDDPLAELYRDGNHSSYPNAGREEYTLRRDGVTHTLQVDTDTMIVTDLDLDALGLHAGVNILELPYNLETIASEAFAGTPIKAFTAGNQLTEIGSRAFASCPNLVAAFLSPSINNIADNAFAGSANVHIYSGGNYARSYCYRNGIPFIPLK